MILLGSKVYGPNSEEYIVEKSLGSGGFGQVFLVKNGTKSYALKIANADGMTTDEYAALLNEGKLAVTLNHENVMKVHYFHDGKEHAGLPPYLLMDLADGGSLREFIDSRKSTKTFLSAAELKDFFTQVCNGMKAVNATLIHRDFHPGNILFQDKCLKITDFGLSKISDAKTRTNTFKGIQHIYYKAPESWKMQKNTIQMDMYSVGIAFYELATLEYPYSFPGKKDRFLEVQDAHFFNSAKALKSINKDITDAMAEMISRLLKKKPDDRFRNWDDVLAVLNSDSVATSSSVSVGSLVAKARTTDQVIESKKIEAEKARSEQEEKVNQLQFAVSTIKDELNKLVVAFNSQTQTSQLAVADNMGGFNFRITSSVTRKAINCQFAVAEQLYHAEPDMFGRGSRRVAAKIALNGRDVMFWGSLYIDRGPGINLALTRDSDDDLYGSWKVLIHRWHALNRQRDGRPEPFPLTNWEEFARQVQVIRAMGLIETQLKPFSLDEVKFLFEGIL